MTVKDFQLGHSFVSKLIIVVGITLLFCILIWAYFNITYQQKKLTENIITAADRLTTTIRLGTHYAMLHNSRDDINQIINDIGKQQDLTHVRIYNKEGTIKFSNIASEVDQLTNIKAEACDVCHQHTPPLSVLNQNNRTRIFTSEGGQRLLGVINPIYNEPGCAAGGCHLPPSEKRILGALDVVVSMGQFDQEIMGFRNGIIAWAVFSFVLIASILCLFVMKFIKSPIEKIIDATEQLARGNYHANIKLFQNDELGKLAQTINNMGKTIGEKQTAINKQRNEYQRLFEMVPCIITVQDKNFRLISYNRQFEENFNPKPGDYCYCAYKARDEKCESCPVERTFLDGQPHSSYETAVHPDGSTRHWFARTSPIVNEQGEVIAAMEMSIDITHRKLLQEALEKSEKKYFAIFENIPNPVFVLEAETLGILDCNGSVQHVYGYTKEEIKKLSFLSLFNEVDKERIQQMIYKGQAINQVKQIKKDGSMLYANIRVSPSEYPGEKVYLVTTSDITQWLETEQQLIQAGKMATLGEMATGVAHELNQPLSVIKTASGFFIKKVKKHEPISEDILQTLAEEIDVHVDRATKIINHMREFGRKADEAMATVQVEDALKKAFELFSKQLELREIDVVWHIDENLPSIQADPSRLEQVFINLLINARDAMEDKWATEPAEPHKKQIDLSVYQKQHSILVDVKDTGPGVSKAIVEKIFEPFFTTKKVGKGTGLGLSISYSIIKEFGGTIEVVPRKTEGACFRLTFPIHPE